MESALAWFYCAAVAVALQVIVLLVCARNPAMWHRRNVFRLIACVWSLMPIIKSCYIDQIVPPSDALEHEAIARDIADSLSAGNLADVAPYVAPGNSAYRLCLGVFYFVTGAPEIVVYAVNGALGLIALLFLLDVMSRHAGCPRMPLLVVFVVGLLPSALLWTTANLKEGIVLWGICAMLYLTLPARSIIGRTPRLLPVIGLILVASQRPHIAAAWLAAIAAGAALRTKGFSVFAGAVAAALVSAVLFKFVAPDLYNTAMSDGVSATLNERFKTLSARDSLNGGALADGNPIPVVSGLLLILFRPWPFEVNDAHTLLVGLEPWGLALLGFASWWLTTGRMRIIRHPAVMTQLVALIALSFYFSYMYNMGLVVRQRLMCFPAVLFIYFFPLLTRRRGPIRAVSKQTVVSRSRVIRLANSWQPRPNP